MNTNVDTQSSERWLPVVGYEGLYLVSSEGRVYSFARRGASEGVKPQHLATSNGATYYKVKVTKDGRGVSRPVHILVAEAFIGPRQDGQVVRHRDGDSLNNRSSNLEYGTVNDNNLDKMIHRGNLSVNHCKRGHLLKGANLDTVVKGNTSCRNCKSCGRAMARIRSAELRGAAHGTVQDVSDDIYRKVMAGTYQPWARS